MMFCSAVKQDGSFSRFSVGSMRIELPVSDGGHYESIGIQAERLVDDFHSQPQLRSTGRSVYHEFL